MAQFFSADYKYLWMLLLAACLFYPVRQLIWVLQIRRAQKKTGEDVDEKEQLRIRHRAGFTAALLCLIFAYLYISNVLFPK